MYASAIYLNLFLIVEFGKLFKTDSNDAEFSFDNQLVVTVYAVLVHCVQELYADQYFCNVICRL